MARLVLAAALAAALFAGGCGAGPLLYCLAVDHDINLKCQ
jgi:hypothetical protein